MDWEDGDGVLGLEPSVRCQGLSVRGGLERDEGRYILNPPLTLLSTSSQALRIAAVGLTPPSPLAVAG